MDCSRAQALLLAQNNFKAIDSMLGVISVIFMQQLVPHVYIKTNMVDFLGQVYPEVFANAKFATRQVFIEVRHSSCKFLLAA